MDFQRNGKLIQQKYKEFFIPTLLTAMSSSMAIIVDGIIVGNILGSEAMAAVNVCMPIMQLYATIAVLFGMGAATCISIASGRGERSRANSMFTTLMLVLAAASALLFIVQFLNVSGFCRILTDDEILYPLAYEYYRVLVIGTPAIIIVTALAYIVRSEGHAKLASHILLTSNILNLLLDLLLMGVFKMGIEGSAIATVLGYVAGAAISCRYLFTKKRTLHIDFSGIGSSLKSITLTGFPAALSSILITLRVLIINRIVMETAGSLGMIAFSVCMSCLSLLSLFISGAAQTMMPILGIFYGEKDYGGVRLVTKQAFKVLMLCSAGLIVFLEIFPSAILWLYGVHDPAAAAMAIPAIRWFSISLLGTAVTFLMIYFCMATERKTMSTIITIVEGIAIVVPCAYLLSAVMGIDGVWISFIVSETVTIVVILAMLKGKPATLFEGREDNPSVMDISLTREGVSAAVEQAEGFLRNEGFTDSLANKIGVAIEEMTENISKHSGKSDVHIDVRIKKIESGVLIAFCDDGVAFDPLNYEPENNDEYKIDEITMIKLLASNIEYRRVIGLNKTIITISGEKELGGLQI